MSGDNLGYIRSYIKKTLKGAGALKGEAGASAYEIAKRNGFQGTEVEWLENLKAVISDGEFNSKLTAYLTENSIGGTTKVINVMNNSIANCKIDGETDDYPALALIRDYINKTTEPIIVLFPWTGKTMLLSEQIFILRSNVTFEVFCDVQLTKTLFAENENMNVFKFGSYTRMPISNINFNGHGITIDANGASLGIEQEKHTQVAEGNGIRFQRVFGGSIKGVHVKNAVCDNILVYTSKNIVVEDCEVSGAVMDNGLTVMGLPLFTSDWVFSKYEDRCRNNVIVRNCTAHNNEDLGFSASVCHGVTFENCVSYENGNVDGFNAGGGYSAEILFPETKLFFEVPLDFDMDIAFRHCKALNNNNYAYYIDVDGVTIDNCIIDKTIANDTTTSNGRNTRGGNGIFFNGTGRLDIINPSIANTAMYAICINPNSKTTVRLEKVVLDTCEKGIYVPCVEFLYIKDLMGKNTKTPLYLNDGTKKKYVELKNISLYDCLGVYIGGAEYMDVDNIYLRTASGITVGMTLGNVNTGVLQNAKIYKGDNTSWLTGIYVNDTVGIGFSVSENVLTDANTAINDKRTTA